MLPNLLRSVETFVGKTCYVHTLPVRSVSRMVRSSNPADWSSSTAVLTALSKAADIASTESPSDAGLEEQMYSIALWQSGSESSLAISKMAGICSIGLISPRSRRSLISHDRDECEPRGTYANVPEDPKVS